MEVIRAGLVHFLAERSSVSGYAQFKACILRTSSDYAPCRSKTKLFRIEFSDPLFWEEDFVTSRCDPLESQLFEAECFADQCYVFCQLMS
jgi:hypothetical protein